MTEHTEPRLRFIDPDFGRTPKTRRFCVRCQKDVTVTSSISIRVTDDFFFEVHPDDATDDNSIAVLIGRDCYSKLPKGFSR